MEVVERRGAGLHVDRPLSPSEGAIQVPCVHMGSVEKTTKLLICTGLFNSKCHFEVRLRFRVLYVNIIIKTCVYIYISLYACVPISRIWDHIASRHSLNGLT